MEIPQDIIDNVIAAVGYNTRLLKKCTLVSSSFLLPSRKQLFSRIYLRSDQTCQGIHQLLVQNPVIQSFVRTITLEQMFIFDSKFSEWMNGTSLLAILRLPFCCLERFSIIVNRIVSNPWNWNRFSSELKDALSNITLSSTLKTISLRGITRVPITFFLHIVHLTTLELHSLSPNDIVGENSSSLTRAASKGMSPMASQTVPVIDRCVWRFRREHVHGTKFSSSVLFPIKFREGRTESIFLPFMSRLRFFGIYFEFGYPMANYRDLRILSILMGSLFMSLTSPATLEHLELNIRFSSISNLDAFYENLRNADVWSYLDSIITTYPTGSRLRRVDININYFLYEENEDGNEAVEDEILKVVLDGLPLLRMKGILFVKAEDKHWSSA